jgi:hypothetical protein
MGLFLSIFPADIPRSIREGRFPCCQPPIAQQKTGISHYTTARRVGAKYKTSRLHIFFPVERKAPSPPIVSE